ncbi:MAG: zinc dependent phospholipase C family protein [Lachnospiraceae bacterium]|nr:zinc dependent phospholipase C family protein [Lachnospiraceae bacterium]
MASRIMHYIVGHQVSRQINFQNPERFLFGNMLPDCVNGPGGRKGPKAQSHFWEWDEERCVKGHNWNWFWDKYKNHREDELYLGYFCHLVTDAVWGVEVYLPMKKENASRLKTVETLYRDYHRMNELLREKFHPAAPDMQWLENEMEEVEKSFWDFYYRELLEDLQEDTGAKKEDLELMDYDRIVAFIESAASVSCEEILAKREGRSGREPEEFYRRFNL